MPSRPAGAGAQACATPRGGAGAPDFLALAAGAPQRPCGRTWRRLPDRRRPAGRARSPRLPGREARSLGPRIGIGNTLFPILIRRSRSLAGPAARRCRASWRSQRPWYGPCGWLSHLARACPVVVCYRKSYRRNPSGQPRVLRASKRHRRSLARSSDDAPHPLLRAYASRRAGTSITKA